ncbi:hypothetical protein GGX14DRAFT_389333 [Mycena pura]|uniref:Uncharacterized protein n=1 Tax=Mycena pura TaxID=153505 RepID=A0AAD6VQB2_9AGAR|nr:hypothetical protein GGX14DRAFT_389333 [Mycena pura]
MPLRSLGLAAEGLPTILDGGRQTRGRQTMLICAEMTERRSNVPRDTTGAGPRPTSQLRPEGVAALVPSLKPNQPLPGAMALLTRGAQTSQLAEGVTVESAEVTTDTVTEPAGQFEPIVTPQEPDPPLPSPSVSNMTLAVQALSSALDPSESVWGDQFGASDAPFLTQKSSPQAPNTPILPGAPGSTTAATNLTTRDALHPNWFIRCLMYLVAFLHTRHRVTFRAAGLILISVGFIFSCFCGNLIGAVATPRTLKSTFCPDCDEEVFGAGIADNDDVRGQADTPDDPPDVQPSPPRKRKPYMVAAIQLLSVGLHDFFKRPGMVSAVNAWKTRTEVHGELRCMQDGKVWKEIKDVNKRPFFYGPESDEDIRFGVQSKQNQLRSKLFIGSDVLLHPKPRHIFMVNVDILYIGTDNLILSGMTGRKEPQLQRYLKIIVDCQEPDRRNAETAKK